MTDTYIKMCAAADEIQAAWEPKYGDRWQNGDLILYVDQLGVGQLKALDRGSERGNVIWLPRQEDLQRLTVARPGGWYYFLIDRFHEFAVRNATKIQDMDELWLAFYMEIAHQKEWDGEKWVAEEHTLGQWLFNLRQGKNWSLRDVGTMIGESHTPIYLLEKGSMSTATPHYLWKLAKIYNESFPELMRLAGYEV